MGFQNNHHTISAPIKATRFLSQLGYSNAQAQKILDKKRLMQNGKAIQKSSILETGEVNLLEFYPVDLGLKPIYVYDFSLQYDINLDNIAYTSLEHKSFVKQSCGIHAPTPPQDYGKKGQPKDLRFCVMNKPAKILTHPKNLSQSLSLLDNLRFSFGAESNPCHRLDYETSGLVICSIDKESEIFLKNLFLSRKIKKSYLAVVQGSIANPLLIESEIIFPQDFGNLCIQGQAKHIHITSLQTDEIIPTISHIQSLHIPANKAYSVLMPLKNLSSQKELSQFLQQNSIKKIFQPHFNSKNYCYSYIKHIQTIRKKILYYSNIKEQKVINKYTKNKRNSLQIAKTIEFLKDLRINHDFRISSLDMSFRKYKIPIYNILKTRNTSCFDDSRFPYYNKGCYTSLPLNTFTSFLSYYTQCRQSYSFIVRVLENYLSFVYSLKKKDCYKNPIFYNKTKKKTDKSHTTYSFVKLFPITGRTHQLRIHTACLRHAIVGDTLYGREDYIANFFLDIQSEKYIKKDFLGLYNFLSYNINIVKKSHIIPLSYLFHYQIVVVKRYISFILSDDISPCFASIKNIGKLNLKDFKTNDRERNITQIISKQLDRFRQNSYNFNNILNYFNKKTSKDFSLSSSNFLDSATKLSQIIKTKKSKNIHLQLKHRNLHFYNHKIKKEDNTYTKTLFRDNEFGNFISFLCFLQALPTLQDDIIRFMRVYFCGHDRLLLHSHQIEFLSYHFKTPTK
ncbi:hypothetical protein CQA53_07825 [Helicobacter didelphidarum]|uniref:RNA pseudouridylate synthase n=1 Tax=Helicobacter didelphidarum TaxID=2040648 RepID=A0A3D8IGW8_9HELI|nr:pseudouridine synthase [Helicobacter didelphidarum]RDU64225.1 hypothetical protein CQA53_07825 [Helicobacter didelphidarum]